jgi:hypothetical protein
MDALADQLQLFPMLEFALVLSPPHLGVRSSSILPWVKFHFFRYLAEADTLGSHCTAPKIDSGVKVIRHITQHGRERQTAHSRFVAMWPSNSFGNEEEGVWCR